MSDPTCPGCAGTNYTTLPWGTGPVDRENALAFELFECRTCGLVRLHHTLEAVALEGYRVAFYLMLRDGMSAKDTEKALALFDGRAAMLSHLPSGRLLDVGCDRGYFLEAMRRRGWSVHGTEPYEPFAQVARDQFGLDVQAVKLEDYRGEGFDLITLWHVLEHFPDPGEALAQCARLLRPGGTLFFEVPNIDGIGPRLGGCYWLPFREPTHRWFFRAEALRRLAERAGLALDQVVSGHTRDAWYGIKRGIQGRLTGVEYYHSKLDRSLPRPPAWMKFVASVATFYPVIKLITWGAARFGRGEVLRGWCRRPPA